MNLGALLNRLRELEDRLSSIEHLRNIEVTLPLTKDENKSGDGSLVIGLQEPITEETEFWARIDDYDAGTGFYGWVEAVPTGDGTFEDNESSGLLGTVDKNPLYQANGLVLGVDSHARIKRAYYDEGYQWVYVTDTAPMGITSINSQTGPAITLAAGPNITITPTSTNVLTIEATGGGSGLTSLTSLNGQTGPAVRIGLGRAATNPSIGSVPQAWSNSIEYYPGDIVSYIGDNYYCILQNTNFAPTDPTYWTLTTEDLIIANLPRVSLNTLPGATFTIGLDTSTAATGPNFRTSLSAPAWSPLGTYLIGDVVSSGGIVYYCKLGNINAAPPNSTYWTVVTGNLLTLNLPYASITDLGLVGVGGQHFFGPKHFHTDQMTAIAVYEDSDIGSNYGLIGWHNAGVYRGLFLWSPSPPLTGLHSVYATLDELSDSFLVLGGSQSTSFAVARGPSSVIHRGIDTTFAGATVKGGIITAASFALPSGSVTTTSLAASFYLPPANAGTVLEAENKSGSTISPGMVVTTDSSGTGFVLADATDIGKSVTGIARESIANTVSGEIQSEGLITLADWTAATGSATLAAKANYFSDPANPGKMTTTVPTATGHVVQVVGTAVSTDTLDLVLSSPILL